MRYSMRYSVWYVGNHITGTLAMLLPGFILPVCKVWWVYFLGNLSGLIAVKRTGVKAKLPWTPPCKLPSLKHLPVTVLGKQWGSGNKVWWCKTILLQTSDKSSWNEIVMAEVPHPPEPQPQPHAMKSNTESEEESQDFLGAVTRGWKWMQRTFSQVVY